MSISVKELESAIANVFKLKEEYEQLNQTVKERYAALEAEKGRIIGILEELELASYKSKAGTFSYSYKSSYRVPKTEEDRQAFFQYLKDKGIFDDMITVNSATLNSWAKAENEALEASGSLEDLEIPGLEKTDPVAKATMRAAR